jgi:Na+/H+ antiporter NhaD/arsenite permease-like protein
VTAYAGAVIFLFTYVLISVRHPWFGFDRPAGALVGAVACVIVGVLSPEEALAAVDGATVLLLFSVMGLGAFLDLDGFFARIEALAARWAKTPARLLGLVVWGSGILSALITNDAVCILGAPVIVRQIQRYRLPRLPFLLAIATAANTGSAATLVGNPQAMLCANLGKLGYLDYLLLAGPIALSALALNHLLLALIFRRALAGPPLDAAPSLEPPRSKSMITVVVIGGTMLAYGFGAHLAWASAAAFVLLMLLHRSDARLLWTRIDFTVLLFFAGLFIVVEGLMKSGLPALAFAQFPLAAAEHRASGQAALAAIFLVGSNVVSNVPFILVVREHMASLADPQRGWELLAIASTFAGNLTLVGSVANIIVAESAREIGGLGFLEHLKVGLPLALGSTALAVGWMALVG